MFRLIVDKTPRPGAFHMAADDFLARTVGDWDGAFRTYSWSPPAISLGTHQDAAIVDFDANRQMGWDVVRRPTGGRALLHRNDVSYAFVLRAGGTGPVGLRVIYGQVARAIAEALDEVGIAVDADSGSRSPLPLTSRLGRLCMTSQVRGELLHQGRKIAAAAQRIYPGAILQHGSLPLTGRASDIAIGIRLTDPGRESLSTSLERAASSLEQAASRIILSDELMPALERAIQKAFQGEWQETGWSLQEIEQIERTSERFHIYSDAGAKMPSTLVYPDIRVAMASRA